MTKNDSTIAFSINKQTPVVRFLASLSDGRTVIQDNRKGARHAWARLSEWMKSNKNISISNLRLQGPNGVDITTPKGQKGYFFGQKRGGLLMSKHQYEYIGIGYYDGQKIVITWHCQPEFDSSYTEERDVAKAGFSLIKNP